MGASVSSNYAEQAQQASQSFSTSVGQEMKTSQSAVNEAVQECSGFKVVANKGAVVEACQMELKQGISAKQVNEAFQTASIENESYTAMQQKMSQAAKALVKGFNFGAYSQAGNTVRQSMTAAVKVSNEVSQNCSSGNAGVNKVLQTCKDSDIRAEDGSTVKFCNTKATQEQLIEQVAKCRQDTAVTNKAVQNMTQTAKQVAVASSIGIDPLLLGIVGIVIAAIAFVVLAKRATDPKFVRVFAAIACLVAGSILVVLAMMNENKPGSGRPDARDGVPVRQQVCRPSKFSRTKSPPPPPEKAGAKLSDEECLKKGDVCEYNLQSNACQLKKTLGLPTSPGTDKTPEVNDACMADEVLEGGAGPNVYDAKGFEYVGKMKDNEFDQDSNGLVVKAVQPFSGDEAEKKKFSREKCYQSKPYCKQGCVKGFGRPHACGIAERDFVGEAECEKRPAFVTKDGGRVKGCKWRNGQCVNNNATDNNWTTKAYSCVQCQQDTPKGAGILYTLSKPGLPSIAKATWTANAWNKYATGEGGGEASVNPEESAALQCANPPLWRRPHAASGQQDPKCFGDNVSFDSWPNPQQGLQRRDEVRGIGRSSSGSA